MIEVRGITKNFGTTRALDKVSFRIDQGEILGFLGPNGAGKSTTMKIITTFLAPDEGTVTVDGIDVLERPLAVRGRIGYLPENVPLYLDMSVHEYLKFVGEARGLSGNRLQERLDWCVQACGLAPYLGQAATEHQRADAGDQSEGQGHESHYEHVNHHGDEAQHDATTGSGSAAQGEVAICWGLHRRVSLSNEDRDRGPFGPITGRRDPRCRS